VPSRRVVYLCPSYGTYWVQIFDSFNNRMGKDFTVVTQSIQDVVNAKIAQGLGDFQRKVVAGGRISISGRNSDKGRGTPFGLNIAPALPWALLRIRPQVVIANNFGLWSLAAIVMGYPTVLFWEGTNHTERTVRPWRIRLRRWMAQKACAFVVNGSAAMKYLCDELYVPKTKIFVGSLCSDPPPKDFSFEKCRDKAVGRQPEFLFVGRLVHGKGVDHLLRAAALQLETQIDSSNFTVTIVGEGPQRQELEKLVDTLGIGHVTRFVGAVHPNEIWKYYYEADVFVLPTLQDNWPLVVLEAMSVGLPILLSRFAGSLPDLILEGKNGYGFTPSDHSYLASLMTKYINNPDLIVEHGRMSLTISEKYDANRSVDAFLQATSLAMRERDYRTPAVRK